MLLLARLRQGGGCRAAVAFTWFLYPALGGLRQANPPQARELRSLAGGVCQRGEICSWAPEVALESHSPTVRVEAPFQPEPLALLLLCSVSWVGIPALQLAWLRLWHSILLSCKACSCAWCGAGTAMGYSKMQLIALPSLQNHKLVMSSVFPKYPVDPELHLVAGRSRHLSRAVPVQLRGWWMREPGAGSGDQEGELGQVVDRQWL